MPFVCGCGRCEWCAAGAAQVCPDQQQPGFTHWGSFAEQVALHVADANLVAVPDSVDAGTAAALGCRFATAYRALAGRRRVVEGERVTVVGAGGVGLSAVMIAGALGARVVAVDPTPRPSPRPRPGAEHALPAAPTCPAAVADLTGGGAHVTVDAAGARRRAATAVRSLRRPAVTCRWACSPPVDGTPASRWTG